MAENKKSFLIYCDIIHSIDHLTDEEKGRLFQHLLEYVNDLNPTLSDRVLISSWKPIEQQLKRDLKKYEAIVERNRNNGSLGGRPPKKPSGLSGNPDKPKKADTDNDTVTDNVNDNVDSKLSFIKEILLSENQKISTIKALKAVSLIVEGYEGYVEAFLLKLVADDDYHKSMIEIKKHFNNWLRSEIKNKPKEKKTTYSDTKNNMSQNLED